MEHTGGQRELMLHDVAPDNRIVRSDWISPSACGRLITQAGALETRVIRGDTY